MNDIKKGLGNNFSIVSSNCFAGRIYQDLKLQYTSPTEGLFLFFDDYVKFVEHFKDYIHQDVEIIEKSKWQEKGRKCGYKFDYPIGQIEGTDVEIHFLHYHSHDEAISKWRRRCARVSNNVLFIGFYDYLPNEKAAEHFLSLKNTVLFTTRPIKSSARPNCLYVKDLNFLANASAPYTYARIYYKYLSKYFNKSKTSNISHEHRENFSNGK